MSHRVKRDNSSIYDTFFEQDKRGGKAWVLDHAEIQDTHPVDMLIREFGPSQTELKESRDLCHESIRERHGQEGVIEQYRKKRGSEP